MINLNSKEILTKGFDLTWGVESLTKELNKWLQENDVTVIDILFSKEGALVVYKENYIQ